MNQSLLRRVKKLHWEFNWSGNWPLLDSTMESDELFQREHRKISGAERRTRVEFMSGGRITVYHALEEREHLDSFFLNKFKKDPAFLRQSASGYRKRVTRDLQALELIYKISDLSKLSDIQLFRLFVEARSHFAYNAAIDYYDSYMERLFIPRLEVFVRQKLEKIGKADQVACYVNTLIIPHKISETFKERRDFFTIVRYMRRQQEIIGALRHGQARERIFQVHPRLRRLFSRYLKLWVWMPVLVNHPPYSTNFLWKELSLAALAPETPKLFTKRLGDNYDRRVIKKSIAYLKALRPDPQNRELIEGLRIMAFLRTEDYWVMSKSSFLVRPLYTEIASRLGITYYGLKEFTPEEVIRYLRLSQKITKKILADRRKLSCNILLGHTRYVCTGREARVFQQVVTGTNNASGQTRELKGMVANAGKTVGRVKITLSLDDLNKMRKGQIAVGAFMSSMFTTGLQKASAIIVEHAGLTSHPVIVARESQIPCVVGAKNATKIFKDGDLVEVDATKGIVRKL